MQTKAISRNQARAAFTNFQVENSNNIISGILYNQYLIDTDSCSNIVGYFCDVAPGLIYKNWQGKLAQLLIYPMG